MPSAKDVNRDVERKCMMHLLSCKKDSIISRQMHKRLPNILPAITTVVAKKPNG